MSEEWGTRLEAKHGRPVNQIPGDLTALQAQVLNVIADAGVITTLDVKAKMYGTQRAAITRTLDLLQAEGWVKLTKKGWRLGDWEVGAADT